MRCKQEDLHASAAEAEVTSDVQLHGTSGCRRASRVFVLLVLLLIEIPAGVRGHDNWLGGNH